MIRGADAALVYELGLHAAQQGFLSMEAVWMTVPPHLRSQALAVSLAYMQHKINGAVHPAICDGNEDFGEQVAAMTAIFDQGLTEQIAAAKRQSQT